VNIAEAHILSATYNGQTRTACLKLYDPSTQKIIFWNDNTHHQPYCLSNLSPAKLHDHTELQAHQGLDHIEPIEKYDPLQFKTVTMSKVVAKDPLSIGGKPSGTIRSILRSIEGSQAWEANIRYYNCYIYDRQIAMGMPYQIVNGKLLPRKYLPDETMLKTLDKLFKDENEDFKTYIYSWVHLLQCPIPNIRRAALDIEVFSTVATRIPDPREAKEPIIAVSIADSDGKKRVLILTQRDQFSEDADLPPELVGEGFPSERDLIAEIFKTLNEYPIIVTFNGDGFDLLYIYNRAVNLGFRKEEIPIRLESRATLLTSGIHIDLYKFFFNRSIQIYAFSQRYVDMSLNGISEALLGKGKIELSKPISQLTYTELAAYCLRDADLSLQLTTFNDQLVFRLIILLIRITKLPIEDLTRQGVSSWIRNIMRFEHRRLNYLIPIADDILQVKGEAATTAIIKGKKFKGAIVVDPKPGVHFNVAVLDFASLYPSIIKVHNLSYETILCPHSTCRSNTIPGLNHWVCSLQRGISSLIIGSLRDMRVKWYKKKAKDPSLSESVRNLYNVVQLTLKVLLNASYGVMGATAFDFYCPPVAETVTAIGRHAITQTVEKAKTLGIDVIYGDTDSVFLRAPTPIQVDSLLAWSETEIGMELEIDKEYRYAVFSTLKKNYLGVYPDGSVDIKGYTGKKRHIPQFLKNAFLDMTQILGEVSSPNDFEAAKNKIRKVVRSCYTKLKKQQYSLDELTLKIMISKPLYRYRKTTPQHVKAARLLTQAGYEIKPGDIISFVKTTNELGVKPIQLAEIHDVDVSKYIEYLKSTFEQVLDAIGIDFNQIMGISTLESFLW
jgi:DNA polymerase I